jgi:hypothetical protein
MTVPRTRVTLRKSAKKLHYDLCNERTDPDESLHKLRYLVEKTIPKLPARSQLPVRTRSAGNLITKLQKITHSDLNNQPKVLNQNLHKSFQLPQITIPKLPARSREPIRN